MDLIVAWLALPAVLLGLCCGCGLLIGALPGVVVPRALVAGCGLALIIVAGQFLVLADATAELGVPVTVCMAVAGLWLGRSRLRGLRTVPVAAVLAAAGVFGVFAAPIVLSGEATLAGFIRLDDTATWLALTDRLLEHGRSLEGLAPSSYEATLAFNLGDGYPLGVFVPLGVAARLLDTDPAWLIQPYMAVLAVGLALALWSLAGAITQGAGLRAAVALVAAQPALLYGYYLWGGIKELAAAALIATAAALAGAPRRPGAGVTAVLAPALVAAALIGVLSGGGLLWLAPIVVGSAVLSLPRLGRARMLREAAAFAGLLGLGSVPLLAAGGLLPPTSSPLTDAAAQGNLIAPLALEQAFGIWPSGDFRLGPEVEPLAYALVALAAMLAAAGIGAATAARAAGPLLYLAGSLVGAAVIVALGSPWVDGKALATASPALLFAAALGALWLGRSVSRGAAAAVAVALAAGVLWSNALAYRDVSLAPRAQLEELDRIGGVIAGEGPTLMTEYQPYGVRHFLRDAEPEGVSELRRRTIPLRDGSVVEKGLSADTDALDPAALFAYRTLVLRRSPVSSRPPAAYSRVWAGETYEVWQRPAGAAAAPPRVALGARLRPATRPRCAAVTALATQGALVAARAGERLVVPLSQAEYPQEWTPSPGDIPQPRSAGTITATVEVARAGEYELWLGGSLRPAATALIDGERLGSVRHELNNLGGYVSFGSTELDAGPHALAIRIGGPDLHPGSGGTAPAVGPLVLSRTGARAGLRRVPAAEAGTLCGRRWDWIELERGSR